jgi:hypothetical protein
MFNATFSNIMTTSFSGGRSTLFCNLQSRAQTHAVLVIGLYESERTNDHGQATGKLYHLRLRVEWTLFVIYKAGRKPTPHW